MKVAYLGGRKGVRRRVRTKFGLFERGVVSRWGGGAGVGCVSLGIWDGRVGGGRTGKLLWCRILGDGPRGWVRVFVLLTLVLCGLKS